MYESLEKVTKLLENQGYEINDPWDVVDAFEKKVAEYAGSKYAVSLDNCTNALFLCLKYLNAHGWLRAGYTITIPSRTYLSVPGTIINAGCDVKFEDIEWDGLYQLKPYTIYDSATRFRKGMYVKDSFQCLSFHMKKILPIGKGGMILTNSKKAYDWFKVARYEGRHIELTYEDDSFDMIGWNMYMPPEQAARGIMLFEECAEQNGDCGGSWRYRDISQLDIFKRAENE